MKGIIESSVYLIIFSIICLFSIDFIMINSRVSKAGEISQYVENYIEVAGSLDSDSMRLDSDVADNIERIVKKSGMNIEFGDVSRAGDNAYVEYKLTYNLSASLVKLDKTHTYNGLARIHLV